MILDKNWIHSLILKTFFELARYSSTSDLSFPVRNFMENDWSFDIWKHLSVLLAYTYLSTLRSTSRYLVEQYGRQQLSSCSLLSYRCVLNHELWNQVSCFYQAFCIGGRSSTASSCRCKHLMQRLDAEEMNPRCLACDNKLDMETKLLLICYLTTGHSSEQDWHTYNVVWAHFLVFSFLSD